MSDLRPSRRRVWTRVFGWMLLVVTAWVVVGPAAAQTTGPRPGPGQSGGTPQPGQTGATTTTRPGVSQEPGAQNPGVGQNPGGLNQPGTVPGVQNPTAPGTGTTPTAPGGAGAVPVPTQIPQVTSTGIPQDSSTERVAQGESVVISKGQLDLAPRMINGTWTSLLRDASSAPAVWRSPRDVVIHLKDEARIPRPAGADYDFLDVPAGQPVYALTQVNNPQTVWLGVSTQDLQAGVTMQRGANLTLTGVDGPGYAVGFVQDSAWGKPRVLWDTRRPDAQPAWFDANTYIHPNLVFSAPGNYRLGFRWSAKTGAGTTVTSDATLRFSVGTAAATHAAAALDDLRTDIGLAPGTAAGEHKPAAAKADEPSWFDTWKYAIFALGILVTFTAASWSVFLDRYRGYRLRKQATREVLAGSTEAAGAPLGDVVPRPHGVVPMTSAIDPALRVPTPPRSPVSTGGPR